MSISQALSESQAQIQQPQGPPPPPHRTTQPQQPRGEPEQQPLQPMVFTTTASVVEDQEHAQQLFHSTKF